MDKSIVRSILENILTPQQIFEDEPLKCHTSFKTGGNATFLVMPETAEQIAELLKTLKNIRHIVIGNGSNLLFPDDGYDGVVIALGHNFAKITVDGETITAQSGALLSKIANVAAENGLGGFEFAAGIPGSLGGAVCMNAGAYGGEMKDVVVSSLCVDKNGTLLTVEDHQFSYRHSLFSDTDLIVLSSTMKLYPRDIKDIRVEMSDLNKRRRDKQPLEFPSAGSTFKRPEGYFAGKLIQDAGLMGYRVGGAMVSEKHAGFVINYDNATTADILALIEHIKKTVYKQFGVELEPEVKIIKN